MHVTIITIADCRLRRHIFPGQRHSDCGHKIREHLPRDVEEYCNPRLASRDRLRGLERVEHYLSDNGDREYEVPPAEHHAQPPAPILLEEPRVGIELLESLPQVRGVLPRWNNVNRIAQDNSNAGSGTKNLGEDDFVSAREQPLENACCNRRTRTVADRDAVLAEPRKKDVECGCAFFGIRNREF